MLYSKRYTKKQGQSPFIFGFLILLSMYGLPQSIVYPIGKIINILTQEEEWILFCQEGEETAILLWDQDSHEVLRITPARFNPSRIQISPSRMTVAFIDSGGLWIRKVWQRHTRALTPERPLGAIVDYCWLDDDYVIACTANSEMKVLYCIDVNEELVYEVASNSERQMIFPSACGERFVYVSRGSEDDFLCINTIMRHENGISVEEAKKIWRSQEQYIGFCSLCDDNTILFLGVPRETMQCKDIPCTIYMADCNTHSVSLIGKVLIERNTALYSQKGSRFYEGMLPILPYYNASSNTLYLPQICHDSSGVLYSSLFVHSSAQFGMQLKITEPNLSCLHPCEYGGMLFYGGCVDNCSGITGSCRSYYTETDDMLLSLGSIPIDT